MAKIRFENSYEGKSPDDCLEVAIAVIPKSGFEIFKIRDIAWLVIAHKKEANKFIELTMGARPPAVRASVTMTISCDDLDEKALQIHLNTIIDEFEEEIRNHGK